MSDYVTCGWYTPDYAHWADRLRANLDDLGEPHDIVEVEKNPGGWEANTMRKPGQVLAAMMRHPAKTIIFLDVDCEVCNSLSELAGASRADIQLHFRCNMMRNGLPRMTARSGTMVIRPTERAKSFVKNWRELNFAAPSGSVDQRTLPAAIVKTPGLAVGMLDNRYCAVPADNVESPIILHSSASASQKKMSRWTRTFHHTMNRYRKCRNFSCSR